MTKAEHIVRIILKMKEASEHEAGLTPADALADEIAGLWAVVDELDPIAAIGRRASRVRAGESQGKPADEVFERLAAEHDPAWREFGIEGDKNVRDILARLNAAAVRLTVENRALRAVRARLEDRLTRIHRAVTEEGAIEKIVLILAEPEP